SVTCAYLTGTGTCPIPAAVPLGALVRSMPVSTAYCSGRTVSSAWLSSPPSMARLPVGPTSVMRTMVRGRSCRPPSVTTGALARSGVYRNFIRLELAHIGVGNIGEDDPTRVDLHRH